MKVALSAMGKFHAFDLARELYARECLAGVYSGYPKFKLKNEGIPNNLLHTFPWMHAGYMAFPWKDRLTPSIVREWENINAVSFYRWLEHRISDCDVYVGLSGTALGAGRKTQTNGGKFVCDRGSVHIRVQDKLLRDEHALWQMPFSGIDPRTIEREEEEYATADVITVPSTFALESFVSQGVSRSKLKLLPYGVNLSRFEPTLRPTAGSFNVLFVGAMSLQKGIPYLLQAYKQVIHPDKSLTFAGAFSTDLISRFSALGLWPEKANVLGHVAQADLKNLMSSSHVLVLPSVQDGFGMVLAQAMACACPVIASDSTGAYDLISEGHEGYIVPTRNSDALTERLQHLADNPEVRNQMAQRALHTVQGLGGWSRYGDAAVSLYRGLLQP